ncbi:hypothetical protein E2C01_075716 [Portunus trituberculatus]|uniref:Uncharacterized protein n=1 Tax=Portunus trituberculatus TaxID=210409 RepID=A0A5B7IFR9_PORTR|nr:hypothetical protein [Portunus trituberculatus]
MEIRKLMTRVFTVSILIYTLGRMGSLVLTALIHKSLPSTSSRINLHSLKFSMQFFHTFPGLPPLLPPLPAATFTSLVFFTTADPL